MKVVRGLKKHSPHSASEIRHFFKTTPLWDRFERGTISEMDFFQALSKQLKLEGLHFGPFMKLWNDIFKEIPESIEILKRLRKTYRLAMISNVNPMHWKHVRKSHSFMHWFDHPIASYAVGHRKPELEIYLLTLRKAKVDPAKAVFIDDVKEHVTAARSIGIRAHQFVSAKRLRKDLGSILD
jgi:putative hydrolase of the HAD superfamily